MLNLADIMLPNFSGSSRRTKSSSDKFVSVDRSRRALLTVFCKRRNLSIMAKIEFHIILQSFINVSSFPCSGLAYFCRISFLIELFLNKLTSECTFFKFIQAHRLCLVF